MSIIPLHLQRRFEQRWAARFAPRVALATPKNIGLKDTTNRLPSSAKEKPAGLVSGLSRDGTRRSVEFFELTVAFIALFSAIIFLAHVIEAL